MLQQNNGAIKRPYKRGISEGKAGHSISKARDSRDKK